MKSRLALALGAWIVLAGVSMGCGGGSKAIPAAGADLGTQLMGSFTDLGGILGSIKDENTAKEALPKLEAANASLDGIASAASQASPEAKTSLSEIATAQIPGLKQLTDQVYAIPGVKPVIQPTLDSMLSKFAKF